MTATSRAAGEREALAHAASTVSWWPAGLALVLVSAAYGLVSETLRVGPPWVMPALAIVAIVAARVLRLRGLHHAGRWTVIGGLFAVTAAITVSAAYLVQGLLNHSADATDLLKGGALLWLSNIVTFGLWYWEVDGGGPAHRHLTKFGSSDFAFPQMILGDGEKPADWMPDFLDYVFLAFNTSTAFSPTDTMVLARRAKVMMMFQSVVSLVTVAVLVARAINAL